MAQVTRTNAPPVRVADDPMESVSNWFQQNSKPLMYGVGAIVVAGASILMYRSTTASTREKASSALYAAQTPLSQGDLAAAATELEKVSTRFSSTASGQQAALVLAQVLYEQKKYSEGIQALEKARGSASADFTSSIESMIATGYEFQGKHELAAGQYEKAATAAKFPSEKGAYQASQARSLMSAGKAAEARTVWEVLAQDESQPYYQEANVRLGELAAAGK